MTTYQPRLTVKAHAKKQRFNCPHCDTKMPIGEKMQCACGATYKLKLKEVCGPSFAEDTN